MGSERREGQTRVSAPFATALVVVLVILLLCGLAWIERAPILTSIAKLWVISDSPQPADAAVVLGGGTDTRPYAAAQLYQRGLVKLILVSNAPPHDLTSDLSDQLAQAADDDLKVLFSLGIPKEAIASLGTGISNTYDEARAAADWARRTRAQRVIVPTEIFPSRRVRWIFNRELRGHQSHR